MKPIPTIVEIQSRLSQNLKTKLNLSDSELKKVLDAVTSALAGEIKLLYLYLSDIQNNIFPDTADLAENGGELNRLGLIYLNRPPSPATDGIYRIKFTGNSGSIVRAGITFKSNDESLNPGKMFIMDNAVEISPSSFEGEIRSLESGLDNLLNVGDFLLATEPIIGVEQLVEIIEVISPPVASESTEAYRKAIIDSIQLEPQGGAKTDYRLWALDVQGVRNVYPFVKENQSGVVQIFVEANEVDSTDGHGTPTPQMIEQVVSVLEFDPDNTKPLSERGRRPIQAILEVLPITLRPVDVDIIGLNQSLPSIQQLIQSNLKSYLKDIRPFIAGGQLTRDKNDILNSARLQGVVSDTLTGGNYFTDFTMYVDGQEESLFTFNFSNIPYLRNVNFI